jgi:protein ImuB
MKGRDMAARIACLLVPDLPLRAELRSHPELARLPLVIASGPDARADLVAFSPEAHAAGVRSWNSVAQASAVCPELEVRVASPAAEQAARDTLLDVALSMSPRVKLAPRRAGLFASEGCVFLDASGIDRIFHSEAGFASSLAQRTERQALPGVVSVAASQTVALLAARHIAHAPPGETLVLSPEQEQTFLAPLPLDLLGPDDRVAQSLTRFGVRTVADLLRLPRRALTQRLGPEMLDLIASARGEVVEGPLRAPQLRRLEEAMDLESPIASLEPLGFVLRGMLSRLTERLGLRALACNSLRVELGLEGGGRHVRRVALTAPTLDVRVLLRLTTLGLGQQPPQAAIETISLSTEGVAQRRDQLDMFRPRGPDPTALDRTLSELEMLCGEGRVGAPEVPDSHHPAAFGMRPFHTDRSHPPARKPCTTPPTKPLAKPSTKPPTNSARAHEKPPAAPSRPAIRALRPPVRAEVRVDHGRPATVRSAISNGEVVMASGPWRTTGQWWSEEERFALDHFDAQISDGSVVRLCFDWLKRVWQIDGIYD